MKKTRMISVIAASLLTATVVFTGCGGGGSSTSVSSSSSSVSSSSSSSVSSSSSSAPQVTVKTVKVSDGYVLQAIVKCKDEQGNDIVQAVATGNPGEYELSLSSTCPVLCAKDGYIDINGNNQVDQGEPKAPQMTAPGSYSNINPFTLLIQQGMTPEEVANAFNLQTTNFDIAIPEASLDVQKAAVKLAVFLSYLDNNQNPDTRECLPGTPCEEGTADSSSSQQTTEVTTVASLADLVAALKVGKKFEEVIPQDIQTVVNNIENAASYEEAEQQAATFLATTNGCYGECGSSSSEATSSSEESSSSTSCNTGDGAFGGLSGEESSCSIEATSSSEESSSSTSCNTGDGAFGGLSGEESSCSIEASSSSEATSSSEESSSSIATGGAFEGL